MRSLLFPPRAPASSADDADASHGYDDDDFDDTDAAEVVFDNVIDSRKYTCVPPCACSLPLPLCQVHFADDDLVTSLRPLFPLPLSSPLVWFSVL